jgi:hypothetical protein
MEPAPSDATNVTTDAPCAHHWVLTAVSDGRTYGTCRRCHAERIFTDARKAKPPFSRR